MEFVRLDVDDFGRRRWRWRSRVPPRGLLRHRGCCELVEVEGPPSDRTRCGIWRFIDLRSVGALQLPEPTPPVGARFHSMFVLWVAPAWPHESRPALARSNHDPRPSVPSRVSDTDISPPTNSTPTRLYTPLANQLPSRFSFLPLYLTSLGYRTAQSILTLLLQAPAPEDLTQLITARASLPPQSYTALLAGHLLHAVKATIRADKRATWGRGFADAHETATWRAEEELGVLWKVVQRQEPAQEGAEQVVRRLLALGVPVRMAPGFVKVLGFEMGEGYEGVCFCLAFPLPFVLFLVLSSFPFPFFLPFFLSLLILVFFHFPSSFAASFLQIFLLP